MDQSVIVVLLIAATAFSETNAVDPWGVPPILLTEEGKLAGFELDENDFTKYFYPEENQNNPGNVTGVSWITI